MTESNENGEHMHETAFDEKVGFINEHANEIAPLLSVYDNMNTHEVRDEATADRLLERFETKAYRFDKQKEEYDTEAKRVVISFSDPSDFSAEMPIIERLMSDRRCSGVSVVTDNVAGVGFAKFAHEHPQFIQEHSVVKANNIDPHDDPVFLDINRAIDDADIAIVGLESTNAPSGIMLFNAKSMFGAKKLYVMNGGWVGLGAKIDSFEQMGMMDEMDGMFVNDALAAKITRSQIPDVMKEKIFETGTPALDALEVTKGKEFESRGREILGITEDEIALLYCGDISNGYDQIDPEASKRINEETFFKTLESIIDASKNSPAKKFVLMVRPHPRDGNKEELLQPRLELPPNLRIVHATKEVISMQEAGYAADTLFSIISTENIMQTLRGKESIFLGYRDPGLGYNTLKIVYGDDLQIIASHEGITLVESDEALRSKLETSVRHLAKEYPPEENATPHTSVDNILNVIFDSRQTS